MIVFPNAKINLGLYITARRPDGYHDISTVMVPVMWRDILEIVPSPEKESRLFTSGRPVDCAEADNLVMKAYRALGALVGGLPPVDIYLEKVIPDGAGLGGGSADASFAIMALNELFNLGLERDTLAKVAVTVGADCPFFIYNRPALCEGIGDRISTDVDPALSDKAIVIAKPRGAAVSTREAYAGVTPCAEHPALRQLVTLSPSDWQTAGMRNDFEKSVFARCPAIGELKRRLLVEGAEYAAMSGSGAAVFGIFGSDNLAQTACEKLGDCDKIVTKARGVNV